MCRHRFKIDGRNAGGERRSRGFEWRQLANLPAGAALSAARDGLEQRVRPAAQRRLPGCHMREGIRVSPAEVRDGAAPLAAAVHQQSGVAGV